MKLMILLLLIAGCSTQEFLDLFRAPRNSHVMTKGGKKVRVVRRLPRTRCTFIRTFLAKRKNYDYRYIRLRNKIAAMGGNRALLLRLEDDPKDRESVAAYQCPEQIKRRDYRRSFLFVKRKRAQMGK
jgi:hypothetical protein